MINLPENVKFIISELEKSGYSAYAVGGCVRDVFLKKEPEDWDITTSASPEHIMEIFDKTVPTGVKHGTVTVLTKGCAYEVTTYRTDGAYTDFRHPESVSFTEDIKDDLARRDFTVNAMAYNEKNGLVDLFGGIDDINSGVIKCVGDPYLRFSEDALRMMRAVRFSAQTGFEIEKNTLNAIKEKAHLIKNVSGERIKAELDKILISKRPEAVTEMYNTGLLYHIIPELARCFETEQNIKYHIYDVGRHTVEVVKNVPPVLHLRYAALFHDIGKPEKKQTDENGVDTFRGHAAASTELAANILNRLKFDNKTKDKILRLIKHHDREILTAAKYVRRAIFVVGDDIFSDLVYLKIGDAKGQNQAFVFERYKTYDEILKIYKEIKEKKEPFSVKNLAVSGNDLLSLGFKGKEVGDALNKALFYVMDNPEANTKEKITEFILKK